MRRRFLLALALVAVLVGAVAAPASASPFDRHFYYHGTWLSGQASPVITITSTSGTHGLLYPYRDSRTLFQSTATIDAGYIGYVPVCFRVIEPTNEGNVLRYVRSYGVPFGANVEVWASAVPYGQCSGH